MGNLSLLTIIVPTYNRQLFAIRQMEYWKDCSVNMHLLDGTDHPLSDTVVKGLPDHIKYHHLPIPLWERLNKSVEMVATPYVMILGDDEFVIPSAVMQCIKELELDEGLISCMGLAALFWYGPRNRILGKGVYQLLKGYKIDQDSPAERMIFHMNPYVCSTVYSVMKADYWKKNIGALGGKYYSAPTASEIWFELGTCCQGRSKVIDSLMWLRSGENPPISLNSWDRKVEFGSWFDEFKFESERREFIAEFVRHFNRGGGNAITTDDVCEALTRKYKYLQSRERNGFFHIISKKIRSVTKKLALSISPNFVKSLGDFNNNIHYYLLADKELKQYVAELDSRQEIWADTSEVSKIIDVVSDFRSRTK